MRKIFYILITLVSIFYILVEFIGDSIIKGSLESNLSNSLGRETKIDDLSISYLTGKANLENLQINNIEFPGKLLIIDKVTAKLNTKSIFSDKIEIDKIIINGIDFNYYFNVSKNLKVKDNVKSVKKNLNEDNKSNSSSKNFIIKKLDVKNIKILANSEELNINQLVSLKDMSFENVGNTNDSNDYKTILTNAFEEAFKSVKNRVLSGNIGNSIDKLKKIDEQKIKEKIKNEIDANKDKVKKTENRTKKKKIKKLKILPFLTLAIVLVIFLAVFFRSAILSYGFLYLPNHTKNYFQKINSLFAKFDLPILVDTKNLNLTNIIATVQEQEVRFSGRIKNVSKK